MKSACDRKERWVAYYAMLSQADGKECILFAAKRRSVVVVVEWERGVGSGKSDRGISLSSRTPVLGSHALDKGQS
jgi:hypothetical protein